MTKPFLQGEPTTFAKLYPFVKSIKLTGKEHGDFLESSVIPYEHRGTLHYTASNLPAVILCSNPRCQQGGYKLQWIIDGIVCSRKTKYENTFHCDGHEGSPKGRRKGASCCNFIKVSIELEYENDNRN